MDSDVRLSSPPVRPREPILSITLVFTGHWLFGNVKYFWFIITDRRIIFFNTDDILSAAGKSKAELSLHDRFRRLVIPEETSVATREKIRAMDPCVIAATYPRAVTIPVTAVASFVLKQEFWYLFTEYHSTRWILEITRRDKSGQDTMTRLSARYFPHEILESDPIRTLFGNRLKGPKKYNNYGWGRNFEMIND
jgi:hypothetical protein